MLADFQTLVDNLVRDTTGTIAAIERDEAIAVAVRRYSQDRPRPKVEDLTPPAGNLIDLPAGWETDVSTLRSLEYPVGEVPPRLLDEEDFQLYDTPTGTQIQLRDPLPAGATVRARYTVGHVVDYTADTVPAHQRLPVCAYAAALLLDQLAARAAQEGDTTLQADSVDRQSRARELAARASALRRSYFETLGVKPDRVRPAAAIVSLEPSPPRLRPRRPII